MLLFRPSLNSISLNGSAVDKGKGWLHAVFSMRRVNLRHDETDTADRHAELLLVEKD